MSAADVRTEILKPMQASFLPPRPEMSQADVSLALESYVLVLAHFDAETLKGAWASMLANHHGRAWPVPGRITAAALHIERESRRMRELAQPRRDYETERLRYWRDEVCRSKQARRAVELRVAWSLKCAVVDDGQKLWQIDLARLVRAHESAEKIADRIERKLPTSDKRGVMNAMDREIALTMYRNLLVNEAKTAQEIMAANPPGGAEEEIDGTQTPPYEA
jgi:hypothetical protein